MKFLKLHLITMVNVLIKLFTLKLPVLSIILLVQLSFLSYAQISPPGLGTAKSASWLALGVRQEIGKGWQSMTYVGIGRKSDPDNFNLIQKQSIWVANQEFTYKFKKAWQTSFAISYRYQDEYRKEAPFEHADPAARQEFRTYGRVSYNIRTTRLKIVPTLRQEFRKYYTPNFTNFSESIQLRTRFRIQLIASLNKKKTQALTLSSEQLFSISMSDQNEWSNFKYGESRFAIYYSYSFTKTPLILSVGYMNNLVGATHPYSANYLSLDLVWENPFKSIKRMKTERK